MVNQRLALQLRPDNRGGASKGQFTSRLRIIRQAFALADANLCLSHLKAEPLIRCEFSKLSASLLNWQRSELLFCDAFTRCMASNRTRTVTYSDKRLPSTDSLATSAASRLCQPRHCAAVSDFPSVRRYHCLFLPFADAVRLLATMSNYGLECSQIQHLRPRVCC